MRSEDAPIVQLVGAWSYCPAVDRRFAVRETNQCGARRSAVPDRENLALNAFGSFCRRPRSFPLALGLSLAVALATAVAATASSGASQATYTIRYALGQGPGSSVGQAALYFKKQVEKLTAGAVGVDIFYTGQLGSNQAITDQTYNGNIQMVTIDPNFLVKYYPAGQFSDMPYLFDSSEEAFAYWDSPVGTLEKQAILKNTGLRVLNAEEFGFHNFANNQRPVHSIADVKGIKMQATGSSVYIQTLSMFGASPVVVPLNEAYTAIQQGVLQGVDLGFNSLLSSKLYEVAPYITVSHDNYSTGLTMVNDKWWRSLPNNHQKVIYAALQRAEAIERKGSVLADKIDEKYIASHGGKIVRLTPAQHAGFVNAVKPLYDNLGQTLGPDAVTWYTKWKAYLKAHPGITSGTITTAKKK
jgi:tripartite ATP-independent transporter DctP family solute receptor